VRDQFVGDGIALEMALGFWVYQVNQVLRRELYRAFAGMGLDITPEQWMVLVRLWEQDGCSQNDLADGTCKDRPTISRVLDVMERNGLVTRTAHPADRRQRVVLLTRKGKDLQRTAVPRVREIVAALEQGVPEADLEVTLRTLQRIAHNLAP
jgi:DNA-binding MarR family transcriptional regulator